MAIPQTLRIQLAEGVLLSSAHADVVTLDGESGGDAFFAESCQRRPGAERPVVEAARFALQPEREDVAVLAEVMEQPGCPRLVGGAERLREGRGALRHVPKVVFQRFPRKAWGGRVCVVH